MRAPGDADAISALFDGLAEAAVESEADAIVAGRS